MNFLFELYMLEYPYWLIVAGSVLLMVGFVGYALSKNQDGAGGGPKAK